MDGGAWWAAVHEVAKSRTRLNYFTFTFHFHALEEEMATHSSVLAWRIPGTEEPGGLPSIGSHRVGHDWSDLAAAAAALLDNSLRLLYQHLLLHLALSVNGSFPETSWTNFKLSFCSSLTSLNFVELKRIRALLWIKLYKQMLWLTGPSIKTTKTSSI